MNKEDKNKGREKLNKETNKSSDAKDDTNTVHSQNEEIKSGKVKVNDTEKKSKSPKKN